MNFNTVVFGCLLLIQLLLRLLKTTANTFIYLLFIVVISQTDHGWPWPVVT